MKTILIGLISLFSIYNSVHAQSLFPKELEQQIIEMSNKSKQMKKAFANLSYEMTQCAAYYSVVKATMEYSDVKDTARFDPIIEKLINTSLLFNIDETVTARFKLEIEYQMKAIHNSAENISILLLKFGNLCKLVTEHPLDRLDFWLAKALFDDGLISRLEKDEMEKVGIPK